jgi:peptidoglycan hydrolase CwlO-like protein
MPTEVITALISAGVTLFVSIGSWHISNHTTRKQDQEKLQTMLDEHKADTRKQIDSLKDEITDFNSQVQVHLAELDMAIKTLSDRVEKHNNLIDRTYKLESEVRMNTSEINHLKERIS